MLIEADQRHPSHRSNGLWSLWDMLTLDASNFVILVHSLARVEFAVRGKQTAIEAGLVEKGDRSVEVIRVLLTNMDLPHSVKVLDSTLIGADTAQKVHRAVDQLINSITLELQGRRFYGPIRRYEQYYEQPKLFGDEVFEAFPSANNDISEAGTCLALERGTASVMHCMRIVEAGLKALAKAMGVGPQGDWGGYLREIDKALEASLKASGKRTPDEQFYAEARLTLDSVRIAWRNPTMHTENNYSPERAEQILIAVRALMQHLATRLSELSLAERLS